MTAQIPLRTVRFAMAIVGAIVGAAVLGCSPAQSGPCDPAIIGYADSRLGVDYRALAPSPVAEILSQAEVERLAKVDSFAFMGAPAQKQVSTLWRSLITGLIEGTLPASFTGSATEPSLDNLRILTPNALALPRSRTEFRAGLKIRSGLCVIVNEMNVHCHWAM